MTERDATHRADSTSTPSPTPENVTSPPLRACTLCSEVVRHPHMHLGKPVCRPCMLDMARRFGMVPRQAR